MEDLGNPALPGTGSHIWTLLTQILGQEKDRGLEGSFTGSVQCIMGLTKCKQIAVKTSNMAAALVFKTVKLPPFAHFCIK